MKSWTVVELNNVVGSLEPLQGLRLQEVMTSTEDVILGFYSPQRMLWLWIDLQAVVPSLLPWTDLPIKPALTKTPLHLFLRAHFVGKSLSAAEVSETKGRVAHLKFGDDHELELWLIPHRRNLLARAGKKKVAWQKPGDLADTPAQTQGEPRSLDRLREEWQMFRGAGGKKKSSRPDPATVLQQQLRKKEQALAKVMEELARKKEMPWRDLGDWLKTNQSLAVPREWELFIDKRRKLAWNIEQCFVKAREADGKIIGTEKRREALQNEIQALRERLAQPHPTLLPAPVALKAPSLNQMEAQGRTLKLGDDLSMVAGKSAADNMKILRQARAWDLWFHMRDFPSSHAILLRNKSRKVSEAELRQAAQWFVRTHFGSKAAEHLGEKVEVVITECRYVKPIKGDKLGRVTYHDERVLIIQHS